MLKAHLPSPTYKLLKDLTERGAFKDPVYKEIEHSLSRTFTLR